MLINNLADLEGSSQIYRFVLQYKLYYSYSVGVESDFYEKFSDVKLITNE